MKKCVVIIPALNEEKTIENVINAIPGELFGGEVKLETVVINDGSSDKTAELAKKCGATVIEHIKPQGVGASFADGIREAIRRKADYAVNIDGDGQMNPTDIVKLLSPIFEGTADMVTASRFKESEYSPKMPKVKRWGNDFVAKMISKIVGDRYYDVSCGFRAYNKETMLRLNLKGKFTYTQETFINLAVNPHIRIIEVPIKIRGEREYGESRVASSILRYAVRSGSIILSAFKDYQPIRFFGRLSLGFFLIGMVFESIFIAHFLITGYFRDYLWAGLTGAFLALVALIWFILMILSDTLNKIIRNEEELLYFNRLNIYYSDEKECNEEDRDAEKL